MAISNDSKKILQVKLDELRLDKQKISKMIDSLQNQQNELKVKQSELQSSIDKIKSDIDLP